MSTSKRTAGVEFTHGPPLGGPSYTPSKRVRFRDALHADYTVHETEDFASVRTGLPMDADWGRSRFFPFYDAAGNLAVLDDAHTPKYSDSTMPMPWRNGKYPTLY